MLIWVTFDINLFANESVTRAIPEYEWGIWISACLQINESCHTMILVTHMNESHFDNYVTCTQIAYGMYTSRGKHERTMSHIWTSHLILFEWPFVLRYLPDLTQSCRTYECVTRRTWMRHVICSGHSTLCQGCLEDFLRTHQPVCPYCREPVVQRGAEWCSR